MVYVTQGLLQLHGMLHENRVSSSNSNREEEWGWGVGFGARYDLTPQDTVMANYYHIEGDNRYLLYTDQNNPAYSSNLDQDGQYQIELNEFNTVQVGYQRKWDTQWRSAFSLAGIRYEDGDTYALKNPNYNETLYNAVANLIYSPTKGMDLGTEYTYAKRKTFAGDEGGVSRLNFIARYNF